MVARSRTLARWAVGAVVAALMTPVLPASPALADTMLRDYSGEGLDAVDDFNDVSTDGGTTWNDAIVVAADSTWATIPNTSWISSDASRGDPARVNTTTLFRRQFRLPPGVTTSSGQLCIHADNAVTVTYNGTTIVDQTDAASPENFSGSPSCGSVANVSTSGTNTLLFSVQNGNGPMGIDFELNLTYAQDGDALPVINLPANITVAASGPSGSRVGYSVTGFDVSNATLSPSCDPPSDTLFAPGTTTTVTCSVTGMNGTTSGSFTVTVLPLVSPNRAPVMSLPGDLTMNASSMRGRTVSYGVTATDDSGIPPTVACLPPPGAGFRVGVTTVTCTATDDQNLTSTGSFTVTVIGPLQRACAQLQESLGITLKTPLVIKLKAAAVELRLADRDRDASTISNLATKVKNSGPSTVRSALRQTVVQTVRRVMDRACCIPA